MDSERPHRGRPSRIDGLPEPIRDEIHRLLRGGLTQTEILDRLRPLLADAGEAPLSPAALSRHASKIASIGQRIRERREIADAVVARLGEDPGRIGEATLELLRSAAFDLAAEDGEVDPEAVSSLALAAQRIERASAISAARQSQLRREVTAEARAAAEEAAAAQGLSSAAAAAIRDAIEGIAT